MLYIDVYAPETVISAFNDCELDKAVHLSRNVYNDSMVTIKGDIYKISLCKVCSVFFSRKEM